MVPDWPQLKTKWRLTGLNEKKKWPQTGLCLKQNYDRLAFVQNKMAANWPLSKKMGPDWPQ